MTRERFDREFRPQVDSAIGAAADPDITANLISAFELLNREMYFTPSHNLYCTHENSIPFLHRDVAAAHDVHAYEMHAHNVHTIEVHAMRCTPMRYTPVICTLCEVHAHETPVYERHAYGMHAYERHAYEGHPL
jgi:hypothetical protein